MQSTEAAVEEFFHAYEHNSDVGNIPELLTQFGDSFLAAGPDGAQCVRGEDFARVLPKRKQFFDGLGCRTTELIGLQQTPLDDRHVVAQTTWRMTFARADGSQDPVEVVSTFLVDAGPGGCRILVYLAHQDIMGILRNRGILKE